MASEWFYTVNGQQSQTPINDAQLKQMATSGQLQPSDMLWKDGMPNWVPANSIKGLFAIARSAGDELADIEPVSIKKSSRKKSAERSSEEEEESGGGILGLHPILVFLLSTCTGGLFGLVYAYFVCSDYANRDQREADSMGRPLGRLRHPLVVILLSYLTLGFYFIYWVYRTISDCAAYSGRKDINPRIDLALMLIMPAYTIYVVAFRLPEMIRAVQVQAKQPEAGALGVAPFFIIPCLAPALPFIGMAYQDALNQVWVSSQ